MDEERPELDYHFYFGVLRRRWPIIVLVCLLTTGVALARSATSTRIYQTTATVLVSDPQSANADGSSGSLVDLPTEIQLIYSGPIGAEVNKKLGPAAAKVTGLTVTPVGETTLIAITTESASPAVAQKAANAYANAYVKIRTNQAIESINTASAVIQAKVTDLQSQIAALDAKIAAAGLVPAVDLTSQRLALQNQLTTYSTQLDRLQFDAGLRARSGAQVVDTAGLPTTPIEPKPARDALLGLALGLVLGLGLAFLTEFLDDKIKTTEDVARYGNGLQVIVELPRIARQRNGRRLVALDDPTSGAAESFRALRTSLRLIGLRQPIQTMLVTSPMSAEGKTTLVANLGVTMARAGLHVIVVDLDLRRAQLGDLLGASNDVGVMSVLLGEVTLAEALYEVPISAGVPHLRLLPAGPLPPNPSEIMGTARMGDLITSLKRSADVVILDTPPLVPVTDAMVLSNRVDGVLVVVNAGKTRRRHLQRSAEYLEQAEAPVIGAVLNGTSQHVRYGYYKKYDYRRRAKHRPAAKRLEGPARSDPPPPQNLSRRAKRRDKKNRRKGQGTSPQPASVNAATSNGNGSKPVSSPVVPGLEPSPEP